MHRTSIRRIAATTSLMAIGAFMMLAFFFPRPSFAANNRCVATCTDDESIQCTNNAECAINCVAGNCVTKNGTKVMFGGQPMSCAATGACPEGFCSKNTHCVDSKNQRTGESCDVDADCNDNVVPSGSGPTSTEKTTTPIKYIEPRLSIPLPGFSFSQITVRDTGEKKVIDIPFLAEYISAVYKFGVGIATIIAAVMMMVGGFQYLTAGGDAGRVTQGKEKVQNAIVGLLLSLGAYTLLYAVNPDLLTLKGLQLITIGRKEYIAEGEPDDAKGTALATSFTKPAGNNIDGPGKSEVPTELSKDIEAAAEAMIKEGFGIYITSSFRTKEKQISLIKQNCKNAPGSKTCDPLPGKSPTCVMVDLDPKNCPHTTGHALDMWGTKLTDGKWVRCNSNTSACNSGGMQACIDDPCQQALIKAMKAQGFCRWSKEAWHFEKPAMSKPCI
jgi:hypothetical protein